MAMAGQSRTLTVTRDDAGCLSLQGKNVRLREVCLADAAFILRLRLEVQTRGFIRRTENDIGAQERFIGAYRVHRDDCYFVIEDRRRVPIGTIRLLDAGDHSFQVGSFIVRPNTNALAAMESFLLLGRYGFEVLGKKKLRGSVHKRNLRHIGFLKKFGGEIVGEDEEEYSMVGRKRRFYRYAARFMRFLDGHGVRRVSHPPP